MHIHILGIAGMGMVTPLALELQRQGHQLTGSDQTQIYPPASDLLKKAKIPINTTPITRSIDLAIIGSSYKNIPQTAQEFNQILQLKIPHISATQYIAKYLIKPESILVAGPFGKTTITALLTWIFKQAKLDPSYLIGGQPINKIPALTINQSHYSIVEADESINGLDTQAKFLYYPVKHLILTGTSWEHKDSYPSFNDNLQAFKQLIQKLPANGTLVYNPADKHIPKLLPFCHCRHLPYQKQTLTTTHLIGQHNQQNISASITLSQALGLKTPQIHRAIKTFLGVQRRLQLIATNSNISFIDDFAQSPPRILQALTAIRKHYPHRPIKVFFEPHASFLQNPASLNGLGHAFSLADEVVLSKIRINPNIAKNTRVTASSFAFEIKNKLKYIPLPQQILTHYSNSLNSKDILVHFSSGGLSGLKTFRQLIKFFKT